MRYSNTLALAQQNLADRIGVTVHDLEFAFIWEFESSIFFSFQINQLGHSQYGSTISIQVDNADARLD